MKIVLYTSLKEYTGIGNYTKQLVNTMHRMGYLNVEQLSGNAKMDRSNFLTMARSGFRRLYFEQIEIPRLLRQHDIVLYHNTQNLGVPIRKKCPTIVTIHDIVPFVFPNQYLSFPLSKFFYQQALEKSIQQSDHIITVSEFSKSEIIKYKHVDPRKITVTYEGFNQELVKLKDVYTKEDICKKNGINAPYVLALGGNEYRKNIPQLVKAFKCEQFNKYVLVIVGNGNEKYASGNVIAIKNIEDAELACLYRYAEVFVFPSFYEGFGLPVVEAMSIGTPVITSKISSLPEIGGEAAIYFNPYDVEDIRKKMIETLASPDLRKKMMKLGYKQISKFSWEKCAKKTIETYQNVLNLKLRRDLK